MSAVDSSNIRETLRVKEEAKEGSNKSSLKAALDRKKAAGGETLLDIIRNEEPKQGVGYKNLIGHKDNKPWQSFRDKLRLKRAGAAWISSVRVPASNNPTHKPIQRISRRRRSIRFDTVSSLQSVSGIEGMSEESLPKVTSSDSGPLPGQPDDASANSGNTPLVQSFKPALPRPNSIKTPSSEDSNSQMMGRSSSLRKSASFTDGRQMSAREAAAQQEAAEAEAAEKAAKEAEEQQPTMSLMDLLEETDRQMGFTGSRYRMGDDDEEEFSEEEEEEEDDDGGVGGIENNCCVCMVKHRGQAFVPCGHSFCRMCSREMMVQKGSCPLCNNFIVEILEVF